jgi:hypothetical protein
MNEIEITINKETKTYQPKEWEIMEFPVSSQDIKELIFTYNNKSINFTDKYNDIMMNQIYYNHKP